MATLRESYLSIRPGINHLLLILLTLLQPRPAISQNNPFQSHYEFDQHVKNNAVATDTIIDSIYRQERYHNDSCWLSDSKMFGISIRGGLVLGPGKASLGFSPGAGKDIHYLNYEANIFSSFLLHFDLCFSYRNFFGRPCHSL